MINKNTGISGLTTNQIFVSILVISILIVAAMTGHLGLKKKAARIQAKIALKEIARLEEVFLGRYGRYTTDFSDLKFVYFDRHDTFTSDFGELNFNGSTENQIYTYTIDTVSDGFTATATANLDSDADLDVWTISKEQVLFHVSRD